MEKCTILGFANKPCPLIDSRKCYEIINSGCPIEKFGLLQDVEENCHNVAVDFVIEILDKKVKLISPEIKRPIMRVKR